MTKKLIFIFSLLKLVHYQSYQNPPIVQCLNHSEVPQSQPRKRDFNLKSHDPSIKKGIGILTISIPVSKMYRSFKSLNSSLK